MLEARNGTKTFFDYSQKQIQLKNVYSSPMIFINHRLGCMDQLFSIA